MKPEDVPDEWAVPARKAYEAAWAQGLGPTLCFRHALAAVLPLAVAEEREACIEALDNAEPSDELWLQMKDLKDAIRARGTS